MNLGDVVSGTVLPGDGTTIYRFNGPAGQRLLVDGLQNDPDLVNLRIVGPGGTLFEQDADADRGVFTLDQAATYFAVVRGRQVAPADYSFRIMDVASLPQVTPGTPV